MTAADGPEGARRTVGVLHGPNLDRLGRRDASHYGERSLSEIDALIERRAERHGADVISYQASGAGRLIDWIHEKSGVVDGWVVNAGGLTHTSVALRDALVASDLPFVEVHLSNVFAREEFRRESVLSDAALGLVSGFRAESYLLGLEGLLAHLTDGE